MKTILWTFVVILVLAAITAAYYFFIYKPARDGGGGNGGAGNGTPPAEGSECTKDEKPGIIKNGVCVPTPTPEELATAFMADCQNSGASQVYCLSAWNQAQQQGITWAEFLTAQNSGSGGGGGGGRDTSALLRQCKTRCLEKLLIPVVGIGIYVRCIKKCKAAYG